MTRITFIHADGEHRTDVDAVAGDTVLAAAQAAGMPLEGTCEGQMACSTCHVIVDPDDFALLKRASESEEDMLDLATGACRTSRLSCQILVDELGDTLTVRIPSAFRDMQGI
jgi:ferredoxin